MKLSLACLFAFGASVVCCWLYMRPPAVTELVVRLDQRFDEVVKNSTYPALQEANVPNEEYQGSGVIWVTKPSVIIKYDDPKNGFVLPPTKFAAVGFSNFVVDMIDTSPMLEALPFEQALDVLDKVQMQLKGAGWEPWPDNNSRWFDLSPAGRKLLHADLFRYFGASTTLVVKKRNLEIGLGIKCIGGCDKDGSHALFLVDVGIGKKSWYSYNGE